MKNFDQKYNVILNEQTVPVITEDDRLAGLNALNTHVKDLARGKELAQEYAKAVDGFYNLLEQLAYLAEDPRLIKYTKNLQKKLDEDNILNDEEDMLLGAINAMNEDHLRHLFTNNSYCPNN
jgi:hypothetical protein